MQKVIDPHLKGRGKFLLPLKELLFFASRLRLRLRVSFGVTPSMAMMADGSFDTCKAHEIFLNIECQKLCNFEQDQTGVRVWLVAVRICHR